MEGSTSNVNGSSSGIKLKFKLGGAYAAAAPAVAALPPPAQSMPSVILRPEATPPPPATVVAAKHEVKARISSTTAPSSKRHKHSNGEGSHGSRVRDEVELVGEKKEDTLAEFEQMKKDLDDTSVALARSQKVIVRLREQKGALLDRVLLLESSAGLTSDAVTAAQTSTIVTKEGDFSAVHPSEVPSLDERFAASSSNLPPRLRSQHYITNLAADRLREDKSAQRRAAGLPASTVSSVALLGVGGAAVAAEVERIIEEGPAGLKSGKRMVASVRLPAPVVSSIPQKIQPLVAPPPLVSLDALPNPFSLPPVMFSTPVVPPPITPDVPTLPKIILPARSTLPPPSVSLASLPQPPIVASPLPASLPLPLPLPRPLPLAVPLATRIEDDRSRSSSVEEEGGMVMARKHQLEEPKVVSKGKRNKGASGGTYSVLFVPRHRDGKPKLPLAIGIMTLKSLGSIVEPYSEAFSSDRYIFPIGFETMRRHASTITRDTVVEYSCRIGQGADGAPSFQIEASDQPGMIIAATTPTGAWGRIVRAANILNDRNHSGSVSGPDYFGLSQHLTKHLIQELPGATESSSVYVWNTFIEGLDPQLALDQASRARKASGSGGGGGGVKKPKRKSSSSGTDGSSHPVSPYQIDRTHISAYSLPPPPPPSHTLPLYDPYAILPAPSMSSLATSLPVASSHSSSLSGWQGSPMIDPQLAAQPQPPNSYYLP